jgi:hypothetical protein
VAFVACDIILRSSGSSRKRAPPTRIVKVSVPSCGGDITAEEGGVLISLLGNKKIEGQVQWADVPPLLAILKVACDDSQPEEFYAKIGEMWDNHGFDYDDVDLVITTVPSPPGEKSLLEAVVEKWSELAECCPDRNLYEEIHRVVNSTADDLLRYAEVFLR